MRKRALAFALSIFTAVSAFAGLDLTAVAEDVIENVNQGSPVSIRVEYSFKDYPEGEVPEISSGLARISYSFDYFTKLDHHGTLRTSNEDIELVKQEDGTLLGEEKLSEIVSDVDNNLRIYIYLNCNGKRYYSDYKTVEYTTDTIKFNVEFTYIPPTPAQPAPPPIPEPPDVPRVTQNWEKARIFCFDEPEENYARPVGGASYERKQGAQIDIRGGVVLYANGGTVENYVGTKDNYKTKQLTLWETFIGEDAGTYNSTKSKQITWIVTADDKCPDNMKQKSDNSVVKVSKGKITAVAPGTAYVWACRVHPDDPTSVSTTESARVLVQVEDAPSKVVLTHEIPDDTNATVVPVTKETLGIGETQQIYIYMESKVEFLTRSNWKIEVTKGSEYLGVSTSGYEGSFTSRVSKVIKGQNNYFYIKAQNMNLTGKPTNAEVTLTNLYTGKKYKLKVNITNAVVETCQPERGADDLSDLIVNSQRVNMSYALPFGVLSSYYTTSAEKNLMKFDEKGNDITPKEYAAILRAPMSDKPKVYVTSTAEVTRDMIFKETKGGLAVNITGEKSKTVTASWESGFLKMNVKKDAAAEKGNIIIVFNTSHDMNGVLIVPYQVTSADPDNTPAA